MNTPPVRRFPEPLDVLRARYARALDRLFDAVEIRDKEASRPGEFQANVFDFEDGLRLIVSRERLPDDEEVLHVSASFPEQCRIADEFRLLNLTTPKDKTLAVWLNSVPAKFRELSDDERPLEFIGLSADHIPHWMVKL